MTRSSAPSSRRRPLAAAALLLACSLQCAQAQTATPLALDLPAQPLEAALSQLARQSGLQLIRAPGAGAGRTAPALRGSFTPDAAFARLLAGSGLQARREGNTIVVQPAPPPPKAARWARCG